MRLTWRRKAPAPPVAPAAPRSPKPPPAAAAPDFSDLEDQARYHRDRLALYRARMHGSRPTSVERLHELERASTAADDRLRTARRLSGGG
jgi:hypothetical protein